MDEALESALRLESNKAAVSDDVIRRCRERAKKMLADLKAVNPKAAAMVQDPSPHVSAICPRRAGKTYAGALAALITGEAKPGSISLIISLNLKQLRRLYWAGGPSGLFTIARKYGLNLEFNTTHLRWEHENGSIGYLLGAEDDEQLEVIRGLEADLYLIDECKSFAPSVLDLLIEDIIDPQRSSREGRLILIGTPGFIASGPFYQATCDRAKDEEGKPYLLYAGTKDTWGRTPDEDLLWSCHTWTLKENTAKPKQWIAALKKKKAKKWADDHPTWAREYLGQWTVGGSGLVFRYGALKSTGKVNWSPQITKKNPAGLPEEGAPWRFIGGLDIGYEAPTALVVAAYSPKLGELRHVKDYSRRHLLPPDIADLIQEAIDTYGPMERIFADGGNLGITIVKTLQLEYGFPIEKADKREKLDYIELLNGGFDRGEVLVIEREPETGKQTMLDRQLLTNAWRLGDEDEDEILELARLGKLKEDPNIPNDSTDAFLYLYRGSLHHFGVPSEEETLEPGSPEAIKRWEKDQLRKARASFANDVKRKFSSNGFESAPSFVRRALERTSWIPSTPSSTSYRHSSRP
jgi:hypothetical protein